MEREAAKLAEQIAESPKYAVLSRDLVMRICQEYLPRYKNQKEALKAVKKQLHIIHGAFFPDKCHERAMELIGDSRYSDRDLSLKLMELHPSTKERLPSMQAFYDLLSPYLREAETVLDIGCGFHPCAFPFMGLRSDVLYRAGDIDHGTAEVVKAFFQRLHVSCDVRILDAVDEMPGENADVAFLFKLVPVLEQQKKGLAYRLIESLRAKTAVITFPIKSLSGREKDMEHFYGSRFEQNLPGGFSILEKEVVGSELVYIVSPKSM
jgi:16S rRNA (guanine(1405)-N(7))-methyltransferase